MQSILKLIVLISVIVNVQSVESETVIPYSDERVCKSNEYFDVSQFKCKFCDAKLLLIPNKNRSECVCNVNAAITVNYDNILRQPICSNATEIESAPKCPYKSFIETNQTIQIQHIQIVTTHSCECPTKTHAMYHNEADATDYCVPLRLTKRYQNAQTPVAMPNTLLRLPNLMFFCQIMRNWVACNHLANLCVLSLYNTVDKNAPCDLFAGDHSFDYANVMDLFHMPKPTIFQKRGKVMVDTMDTVIDHTYDIDEQNEIQLLATSYNVLGQLMHFGALSASKLNLCDRYMTKFGHAIKFGRGYASVCSINVHPLLEDYNSATMRILEVFLNYTENNVHFMRVVPILIRNILAENEAPNREQWQLVNRFFLIDTFTMSPTNPTIRYAKDVELQFHVQGSNKLRVPLLVISYADVNITNGGQQFVDFSFRVTFTKNYSLSSVTDVLLPLLIIIAFVAALFQSFRYKTYQQRLFYDIEILRMFFIFLISNVAWALFLIASVLSTIIFVAFKSQKSVKLLLPTQDANLIVTFVCVAFALKLIRMTQILWRQANVDIFFIDWERSRGPTHQDHKTSHLDTPSVCSSARNTTMDGVSAWRNFFIANEWLELVVVRKISMSVHLLLVILVLGVFGFQNWSYDNFQLVLMKPPGHSQDTVLKLAVGILIYLTVYLAQRIINFTIKERFIKNPIQLFVDICSVANISIFVLSLDHFGYYIHGRSPHGFSDTDMNSMIIQLKREEQNMCGQRGLIANSDHQTFAVLVSKGFRQVFDKLRVPLQSSLKSGPQQHHDKVFQTNKLHENSLDRVAFTYQNINRFLAAFVDHALKDLDYSIQERSFIESILDFEFTSNNASENRSNFILDTNNTFDQVLFYGIESQLLQFELILFSFVTIVTGDYLAAVVVVGVSFQVLKNVTAYLARENLSKKTLIDKRFLI